MIKILLAGEGGQGIQALAEIIASTLHKQGQYTSYIPNFGVEQRGGVSLAFLKINQSPIRYPKFISGDILVAMSDRAITRISPYISDNSLLIFDGSYIGQDEIKPLQGQVKKYLNLPVKDITIKSLSPKVGNIIFLGAILNYLPELKIDIAKQTIEEKFAKYIAKKPEIKDLNFKALEFGLSFAKNPKDQALQGTLKKETTTTFEDNHKIWQRFPEYCKGCGICLMVCPQKALSESQDFNFLGSHLPKVDISQCIGCGLCQQDCPDGAIKVAKKA